MEESGLTNTMTNDDVLRSASSLLTVSVLALSMEHSGPVNTMASNNDLQLCFQITAGSPNVNENHLLSSASSSALTRKNQRLNWWNIFSAAVFCISRVGKLCGSPLMLIVTDASSKI